MILGWGLALGGAGCSSSSTNPASGGASGGTLATGGGGTGGAATGGTSSGGAAGNAGAPATGGGGVPGDAAADAPSLCDQPFCPTGVAADCCNCMQLSCTVVFNACRCEQDCRDLSDCLRNCGSSACEQACYATHTTGANLYGPFYDCSAAKCKTACFQ